LRLIICILLLKNISRKRFKAADFFHLLDEVSVGQHMNVLRSLAGVPILLGLFLLLLDKLAIRTEDLLQISF